MNPRARHMMTFAHVSEPWCNRFQPKLGACFFIGLPICHHAPCCTSILSTAIMACTVGVRSFGQHQAALAHTETRCLMASTTNMLFSLYTDCLESSRPYSKVFAWIQSAPEYWTRQNLEQAWTLWIDCQETFTKVWPAAWSVRWKHSCRVIAIMLEQERTRKLRQ